MHELICSTSCHDYYMENIACQRVDEVKIITLARQWFSKHSICAWDLIGQQPSVKWSTFLCPTVRLFVVFLRWLAIAYLIVVPTQSPFVYLIIALWSPLWSPLWSLDDGNIRSTFAYLKLFYISSTERCLWILCCACVTVSLKKNSISILSSLVVL